jgi:hypothetical protein
LWDVTAYGASTTTPIATSDVERFRLVPSWR